MYLELVDQGVRRRAYEYETGHTTEASASCNEAILYNTRRDTSITATAPSPTMEAMARYGVWRMLELQDLWPLDKNSNMPEPEESDKASVRDLRHARPPQLGTQAQSTRARHQMHELRTYI